MLPKFALIIIWLCSINSVKISFWIQFFYSGLLKFKWNFEKFIHNRTCQWKCEMKNVNILSNVKNFTSITRDFIKKISRDEHEKKSDFTHYYFCLSCYPWSSSIQATILPSQPGMTSSSDVICATKKYTCWLTVWSIQLVSTMKTIIYTSFKMYT